MKASVVDVSVPVTLIGGQTREKSGRGWSLLLLVTRGCGLCDHVIHRSTCARGRRAEDEV